MEKIKTLLNELTEQSKELINYGNSKEKADGYGMQEVINEINKIINTKK